MPNFTDSLRGYARKTLARDDYRCRYCGLVFSEFMREANP